MGTIYFQHSLGESEEEQAFYRALGRNVIMWGRLEACITSTILWTVHHAQATIPPPDEMPIAFKRRIEVWKKVFKNEALVAPAHKDRALKFAAEALLLSKKRNAIMHASIGRYSWELEGSSARSFQHKGPKTLVRDFHVLTSDLASLEAEVAALYASVAHIATLALLRALSPQGRGLSDSPEAPETT